MVYPFVAFLAGYIFERGAKTFLRAAIAGLAGGDFALCRRLELALRIYAFAGQGGLSWFLLFSPRKSSK